MTSFVLEHGRQCMLCYINCSMTLQTEILSTLTSDFLRQMINPKSYNSVLYLFQVAITNDRHVLYLSLDPLPDNCSVENL